MSPESAAALPIDSVIPELLDALGASTAAVLEAPPGAGKTTRVPLALLAAPWLGDRRIVMLEPRRLAARAAARRMATTLGEDVGQRVGYRVRGDSRVSSATQIEVVTEGVLTRMIQRDPALESVGIVIFDEFHERSIHADVGLALCLATQDLLRPDLRILVMSATIDGGAAARLLGDAVVVRSEGRAFPVETQYRAPPSGVGTVPHVVRVVRDALLEDTGSVLVFLSGAGEIGRVAGLLAPRLPADVSLHQLFGAMSPAAQDRAIVPAPTGQRKVVLATNVAETSLTIEGISVVVDGGWMRIPRFSPRTGMTRLETVRVSRASADQRRGRAGRTMSGTCHRCWSAAEDSGLLPFTRAEMVDADLTPLVLDLVAAGFPDPAALRWLDVPPAAAVAEARQLLAQLGALDSGGRITSHGTAMAGLGTHPRLAHMLLTARNDSPASAARAATIAAILDDRDPMRGDGGPPEVDLSLRVEVLERRDFASSSFGDEGLLARLRDAAREWRRRLGVGNPTVGSAADIGSLLAMAYPDRVAQQRGGPGRFLLRNGRGASIDPRDPMARQPWIVAAGVEDAGVDARITLAASLDPASLDACIRAQGETVTTTSWDAEQGAVRTRRRTTLGALVLSDVVVPSSDPAAVQSALVGAINDLGVATLPWEGPAGRVRSRIRFVAVHFPGWPDLSDEVLGVTLADWLAPRLEGINRLDAIAPARLTAALLELLTWEQRRSLDDLAPDRVAVPSGSKLEVDYSDPAAPFLAVRLQEVFGWTATPRIANGRCPLVLHLLSPGYRPVQVTRDLASFWANGYFDVRRDMRGRYPKHAWPDDPLTATAVSGRRRPQS
ncbi:MAG: ATP-dependent helicase HrpB [Gemmatimonadales bacterium]